MAFRGIQATNITASGNISASGGIEADGFKSQGKDAAIWNGTTMILGH